MPQFNVAVPACSQKGQARCGFMGKRLSILSLSGRGSLSPVTTEVTNMPESRSWAGGQNDLQRLEEGGGRTDKARQITITLEGS